MRMLAILALAAAALPTLVHAGNVTVTQNNRANVYAGVQIGGNTTTTLSQTGYANVAGVIQASPRPSATIRQVGTYNQAGIGQTSFSGFSRPSGMP